MAEILDKHISWPPKTQEVISLTEKRLKEKTLFQKTCTIKECLKDTSHLKRDILKQELSHTIKTWENLWRIIFNKTWKSFDEKDLKNIKISPWDKIIFWKDKITIQSQNWKIYYLNYEPKPQTQNKKPKKIQEISSEKIIPTVKIEEKTFKDSKIDFDKDISYENFLKLSKENRLKLITIPSDNWYLKIKFPNKDLALKVKIDDIIPDSYNCAEVIRDKEYLTNKKTRAKLNYFDIAIKSPPLNTFNSAFKWDVYDQIVINDWYLIKPKNILINKETSTIFKSDSAFIWDKIAYENEIIIRSFYSEMIKNLWNSFKKSSVIDENFIYSILAQESRFDPNAISYTKARWLAQLTEETMVWLISKNEWVKTHLRNLKKDTNLWDFLVTKKDLIETSRELNINKVDGEYNFNWVDTELYHPETSIKLCVNYLMYLEKTFDDVENKELRKDLIRASYNWWQNKIRKLYNEFSPKDSNEFRNILEQLADDRKWEEILLYVNNTRKYN